MWDNCAFFQTTYELKVNIRLYLKIKPNTVKAKNKQIKKYFLRK